MNAQQQSVAESLARRGFRCSPHPSHRLPPDLFTLYPSNGRAGLACARFIHGTGGVLDWHLLPGDGSRTLIRSVVHLEELLLALWWERRQEGKA